MTSNRSTEIKVGIVTIAAIALFIIGISLGKGWNVAVNMQTITFRFPHSSGLQKTAPVVVNGVERGSVVSVENDNGSVLITANIDGVEDLRKDVSARIMILEVTGGKKIDIFPGSSDEPYIIGNVIDGTTPPDIAELIALIGGVSGDAVSLIRRLDTIARSGTELLADGKVVAQLRETIDNASRISASFNTFFDANARGLEITLANLRTLTGDLKNALKDNRPKIENILGKVEITLDETRRLMMKADSAIVHADAFILELKDMTGDLRNGGGLASKLLYDVEFAKKMDSTFQILSLYLRQIKRYGMNVNASIGTKP